MASRIRVLLADDHAVLREATAEVIDHQPDMVVVGQSGTGEETVRLTRQLRPDVVVMDIAMPRGSGLEATRQIVRELPETRVLVLTAHEDRDHVVPLLQAGAIGYVPKSVGLNELLDAIRAASQGQSILPPAIASVVVRHLSGAEDHTPREALTSRELEVVGLVSQGLTNQQIAHRLSLSVRTIEAHLTHIYTKLGVGSRVELALMAQRGGWFPSEAGDSEG